MNKKDLDQLFIETYQLALEEVKKAIEDGSNSPFCETDTSLRFLAASHEALKALNCIRAVEE